MKKIFVALVALLWCGGLSAQWKGADEPLRQDDQARVGRLGNGMTYYIRHFENPKNTADFFIAHNVGALQEEDNQNGLAHFLEHMAFNGTQHFPKKAMLEYLAGIGVRFGTNINAFTSQDRTVYNISSVPMLRESVIDTVLLMLQDWSSCISCEQTEIDAERGVVREEWRRSDDSRNRMLMASYVLEATGSKYTERDVIGDPEIIRTFSRETLLDFYHRWYRPDLQAIVVVGDFDVAQMEAKVKALFARIPNVQHPQQKGIYQVPDNEEPLIGFITDPGTTAQAVKLVNKQPYPTSDLRASMGGIRYTLIRKFFNRMLADRYEYASILDNHRYFKRAMVVPNSIETSYLTTQITALPNPDQLTEALEGMLLEEERLRRYGFAPEEFAQAYEAVAKDIDIELSHLKNQTNTDWAQTYVAAFTHGIPCLSTPYEDSVTRAVLSDLKLEDINDAIRILLPRNNQVIAFSLSECDTIYLPSRDAVKEMVAGMQHRTIERLDFGALTKSLFTEKLTPGNIVKEEKLASVDAIQWTLSNGIRFIWKPIHDGSGLVNMTAFRPGGLSTVAREDIAAAKLLQQYVNYMGAGTLNKAELRHFLSKRDAYVMPEMDDTFDRIAGSTLTGDLETMFQLTYLKMVKPRFEAADYVEMEKEVRRNLSQASSDKGYRDSVALVQYGPTPYRQPLQFSDLAQSDFDRVKRLYTTHFAQPGAYTFVLAAEAETAEVRALVERYVASLPVVTPSTVGKLASSGKRVQGVSRVHVARDLRLQGNKQNYHRVTHEKNATPRAEIEACYHGKLAYTAEHIIDLRLLEYILKDRYTKSIREGKGGTYTVSVNAQLASQPEAYATFWISFNTDPDRSDDLLNEVEKGIVSLSESGPTEAELTEAVRYTQKQLQQERLGSRYWNTRIQDFLTTRVDADGMQRVWLDRVTTQDLQQVMRTVLRQDNRLRLVNEQR